MTECNLCETYLNAGLTEEQSEAYCKHLATCLDCRDRVEHWKAFETRLRKWAALTKVREASQAEAYTLMRLASASKKPEQRKNLMIIWAAAASVAASAAASMFLYLRNPDVPSRPDDEPSCTIRVAEPGNQDVVKNIKFNEAIEAPAQSHIVASILEDKVGLSPKTKIRLVKADKDKTRLSLERGTVACKVSKRKPGGEFVVQAGPLTVKVVGTKFSVTREASGKAEVVVDEGVVIVRDGAEKEFTLRANDRIETDIDGRAGFVLRADEKNIETTNALLDPMRVFSADPPLTDAALSTEPKEPTAESLAEISDGDRSTAGKLSNSEGAGSLSAVSLDMDTDASPKQAPPLRMWQNWIMGGRIEDAASAMRRFVKESSPAEPSVWALLADCERKEGNYQAAVRAYEKVMQLGNAKQQARSAYMAASVLQSQLGDHRRALKLFQSYKASAHAAPELVHLADVNIVRSLAALGRCKEAATARERIQRQGSAVVSSNIDQLVENCKDGE